MDFCVPCVYRKRNSFCTVLADTVRAIRVRVTACVHCMRVRFSGPGSLFVTMNGMGVTQVRIKRVYEKPGPDDGFRVLVDRLWPRGIRKEDLSYDLWAKEIAELVPSERGGKMGRIFEKVPAGARRQRFGRAVSRGDR